MCIAICVHAFIVTPSEPVFLFTLQVWLPAATQLPIEHATTMYQCIYQCTSVPVHQCTSIPVYQCASVPVYQCTNVLVYQCTSVPAYQCTNAETYANNQNSADTHRFVATYRLVFYALIYILAFCLYVWFVSCKRAFSVCSWVGWWDTWGNGWTARCHLVSVQCNSLAKKYY